MNEIIDQSISKRPIKMFDEKDIASLTAKIESMEILAEELKLGIEWRQKSEHYQALVADSQRRLIEIALRRMLIPVTDTVKHAEIVGQFNERLLVVRQLADDRRELSYFRKWIDAAWRRIEALRLKHKKKDS